MFSSKHALDIDRYFFKSQFFYNCTLESISKNYSFEAIIICEFGEDDNFKKIITSYGISASPFVASLRNIFFETINECFQSFPKPHIHTIKKFRDAIASIEPAKAFSFSMLFIPLICEQRKYLFLAFPNKDSVSKEIPDELLYELNDAISSIYILNEYEELQKKFRVLENYVKEVGHDIASSVQATVAKLRNLSRGIYTGDAAQKKAKEAEDEIMAAYRVAENLGLTIDPNYNLNMPCEFNLIDPTNRVKDQYQSEANESHVEIKVSYNLSNITVWGDPKAIESAIGQYIFNAIKYAFGGTKIFVNIIKRKHDALLQVINKGIPLVKEDLPYIWDFGYRGKNALDRHVNGAGIGLYTVKKIILAHGGSVSAKSLSVKKKTTRFQLTIPKRKSTKTSISIKGQPLYRAF